MKLEFGEGERMNINNLVGREKEIIREINQGNREHFPELLDITKRLCSMYESCGKCNFISKHKETGMCKQCEGL